MPRYYKPRNKRRRRRRRRRKAVPAALLLRQSALAPTYFQRYPVPKKMKRTLRYMETATTLNPGVAGLAADYVFSANGLYDPNITGVGHQPIGFDQIMTMYNHYTVIGAKLTVMAHNGDATYEQFVGVSVQAGTTAITNGQEVIENGLCKFKYLNLSGDSGDKAVITYPLSIGKYMGRSNILSEDDFRGSSTSNPSEQVYFHVFGFPNNSQDTGAIRIDVIIDYITIFTEPKQLGQS